jgi:hypothetical protein
MGELVSQVRPDGDVRQALEADASRISAAFKSRFRVRAENVELEEIVVQTTSSPITLQDQPKSTCAHHEVVPSADAPLTAACLAGTLMDVFARESDTHSLNVANAVCAANLQCSAEQHSQHTTMQPATPFQSADTESEGRQNFAHSAAMTRSNMSTN